MLVHDTTGREVCTHLEMTTAPFSAVMARHRTCSFLAGRGDGHMLVCQMFKDTLERDGSTFDVLCSQVRQCAGRIRRSTKCTYLQVGRMCFGLGHTTNNVAEYSALLRGLEAAQALGVKRIKCLGDSKLVVEQVGSPSKPQSISFLPQCRSTL